MNQPLISRRMFLGASAAAGIVVLTGCGAGAPRLLDPGPSGEAASGLAYKLSTRGKRASRAARRHAANRLFATQAAADRGRAHAGDRSAIVTVDIAPATWNTYFGDGTESVDLRRAARSRAYVAKLRSGSGLPVPACANAEDVILSAVEAATVALALQQHWGLADASGRPVDAAWIQLPPMPSLGRHTATFTPPHHAPVPIVMDVGIDHQCGSALETKAAIEAADIEVRTLAGADGRIFGSITARQIADALASLDINIDRKHVTFPSGPITTVGTHPLAVTVRQGIVAETTFEVVGQ